MCEIVRLIKYDELRELLNLYKQLQPEDPDVYGNKALKATWYLIYNDPNLYYIVVEVDGRNTLFLLQNGFNVTEVDFSANRILHRHYL